MRLKIALLCAAMAWSASEAATAQELVRGEDTLRYRYTPVEMTAASQENTPTMTAEQPKRRNIFRRIGDYFGNSTKDRTFEKKMDITFAGGPSYTSNTKFGIAILASGLYRVDRTDSLTPPSDISIFGNVSTSGFYAMGVDGNTILSQNRSKIDYTLYFTSMPRDFWGIGYEAGRNNPNSNYVEKKYKVIARYRHILFRNTYLGATFSFDNTRGKNFKTESVAYQMIADQKRQYTFLGLGAQIEYDTRDFIPNPAKGLYISLGATCYPQMLSNNGNTLWNIIFTGDYYQRVWPSGLLAFDLYADLHNSGTPWPMLARMGGSQRMRGYYHGQYTDKNLVTMQVELRQHIWRRIGCAVWLGAGNIFDSRRHFDFSKTLPNYGFGMRWELKKRINIRLDYGMGKKTSGFMLGLNEAF